MIAPFDHDPDGIQELVHRATCGLYLTNVLKGHLGLALFAIRKGLESTKGCDPELNAMREEVERLAQQFERLKNRVDQSAQLRLEAKVHYERQMARVADANLMGDESEAA